jgi:NAD(P)H dehydrogenase (quinone)
MSALDGIVFGCATYMGSASAIFKAFLEAAFQPHWLEQRWKDKIAAAFTNSASQNGDKLCTLLQLAIFAMQMGMIWVGVSDLPENNWSGGTRSDLNRLGTWIGAMGQSNADEDYPSIGDIDTAKRLGSRVALIARAFQRSRSIRDRTHRRIRIPAEQYPKERLSFHSEPLIGAFSRP